MRKKLILLISSAILLVLLAGGYLMYRWLVNRFNLPNETSKLISLTNQLKNFDEKTLAEYNPKTQRAIDVLHYQIKLDLHPEQKKIFGDVTIKMKVNDKRLSKFDINFYDNLIIRDLRLNADRDG